MSGIVLGEAGLGEGCKVEQDKVWFLLSRG